MHTQNEKGRTLIEMMGVVCIIGVLIVSSMSGVKLGMTMMQATSVFKLVEGVAKGVIDVYSYRTTYPVNSTDGRSEMADKIIKSGDICEDCVKTSNGLEVDLPWDSTMFVRPGDESHFEIELEDVPKEACLRLRDMEWHYVEWASPVDEVDGKDEPVCQNEYEVIVFHAH